MVTDAHSDRPHPAGEAGSELKGRRGHGPSRSADAGKQSELAVPDKVEGRDARLVA